MLGVSKQHSTGVVGCPLYEAIYMTPLSRPAASWQHGSVLFRTPDGKLLPYQSGSSKQTSWVELIYARSGAGKSVLLNVLNLSTCLAAGIEALPHISILDIGNSSKGLIDILQMSQHGKKYAQHYVFKMSIEDAINPFDTFLGSRVPSTMHKTFLINLLSIIMLDDLEGMLPEGMQAMLSMVIDCVYIQCADDGQPKGYQKGIKREIDEILQDHGEFTTWWQVVDQLFLLECFELAMQAQKYAMPLMTDLIFAVNHVSVTDLYTHVQADNSENYIQYFARAISATVRAYPGLCIPSKLLIDAHVVAIDLSKIVVSGSANDTKKTVLAYMLARHITCSDFYLDKTDIINMPDQYIDYHTQRLRMLQNRSKRIIFDEFHRTQNCKMIRNQVISDMREGRKYNIQIALVSQSLNDFDSVMLEFATSIFILSGGNKSALAETSKIFGLTDAETEALRRYAHGPSRLGCNFIAQFHTKEGINTQLLNLTLSAYELWAFTTTVEDVYIREGIYQHLAPSKALSLLTQYFPEGTAKPYLESQSKLQQDKTTYALCNELIRDIVLQGYPLFQQKNGDFKNENVDEK